MSAAEEAIARPALRYHGGKWRIASWIVSHFPACHASYVEPFCGAASVFLLKAPSKLEIINDRDGDVITFFRCLRDRPDELLRAIQLTPWARGELREAFEPTTDDLERARRLYVRCWQVRGTHATSSKGSWRFRVRIDNNRNDFCLSFHQTEHLEAIALRLKAAQIEEGDALQVIERYDTPDTLFYCDPPYPDLSRARPDHGYAFEMSEEGHFLLASVLRQIRGMAIVSGYPSPLYDALYAGWRRVSRTTRDQAAGEATEVLWLSPNCTSSQATLPLA